MNEDRIESGLAILAERLDIAKDRSDRLERKLDWLHWALVEADTNRLYGAGYTDKQVQKLHLLHRPWPGDVP